MKYLIYCTKGELLQCHWAKANALIGKPPSYILYGRKVKQKDFESPHTLNGKIVAEFDGEVEEIKYKVGSPFSYLDFESELSKTCLSYEELEDYLFPNNGYAIHINNLKIFDEPLELKEVFAKQKCEKCLYKNCKYYENGVCRLCQLSKAPQNMCYVWHNGELKVLISTRSNWVCKILNGEKTIEVRKKVLKEMIKWQVIKS